MSLNPIDQLNVVTIGAVVAIWLATFLVLRRLLLVPLLAVMQRRALKIEAAAATEADSRALVERAQAEAARIAAEAAAAAERVDRDVKDELLRQREARLAEANAQAQAVSARGREEIAGIRAAEEARVEEQLFACSRQALLKVTERVDDAALRIVVRRVLSGREAGRQP